MDNRRKHGTVFFKVLSDEKIVSAVDLEDNENCKAECDIKIDDESYTDNGKFSQVGDIKALIPETKSLFLKS